MLWYAKTTILIALLFFSVPAGSSENVVLIPCNSDNNCNELINKGKRELIKLRYENALNTFKAAARCNPANDEVQLLIGYCFERMGRLSDALSQFDKIVNSEKNEFDIASAHMSKSRILQQLNKIPEAIEECKLSIKLSPLNASYRRLGDLYKDNRQLDLAIEPYSLVAKNDPGSSIWLELAQAYSSIGEPQKAAEAHAKAEELMRLAGEKQ